MHPIKKLPGEFLESYKSIDSKLFFILRFLFRRFVSFISSLFVRIPKRYQLVWSLNGIFLKEDPSLGYHVLGIELWKSGFFGKGTLSRGEPTWWKRMTQGGSMGESLAVKKRLQKNAILQEPVALENFENSELDTDVEEYRLLPEEAFWLFSLGIASVHESLDSQAFDSESLWKQCCIDSPLLQNDKNLWSTQDLLQHFAIRYCVYHYYRSKGWIVRCGLKFGTEFLIYHQGPTMSHSDYAVLIMPVLEHQAMSDRNTWPWCLGMTRICFQAKKVFFLI